MSIKIEKVDRIVYDISTPNSDKTIDLSVQAQDGAKLGFLHVPTYKWGVHAIWLYKDHPYKDQY